MGVIFEDYPMSSMAQTAETMRLCGVNDKHTQPTGLVWDGARFSKDAAVHSGMHILYAMLLTMAQNIIVKGGLLDTLIRQTDGAMRYRRVDDLCEKFYAKHFVPAQGGVHVLRLDWTENANYEISVQAIDVAAFIRAIGSLTVREAAAKIDSLCRKLSLTTDTFEQARLNAQLVALTATRDTAAKWETFLLNTRDDPPHLDELLLWTAIGADGKRTFFREPPGTWALMNNIKTRELAMSLAGMALAG